MRANLIGPSLLATDNTELASSTNTTRFTKFAVRKHALDERRSNTTDSFPNKCTRYLPLTHSNLSYRYEEE